MKLHLRRLRQRASHTASDLTYLNPMYGRERLISCHIESIATKHVWPAVNNEQTEGLIRSNRQTQKTPAALKPFFS